VITRTSSNSRSQHAGEQTIAAIPVLRRFAVV